MSDECIPFVREELDIWLGKNKFNIQYCLEHGRDWGLLHIRMWLIKSECYMSETGGRPSLEHSIPTIVHATLSFMSHMYHTYGTVAEADKKDFGDVEDKVLNWIHSVKAADEERRWVERKK